MAADSLYTLQFVFHTCFSSFVFVNSSFGTPFVTGWLILKGCHPPYVICLQENLKGIYDIYSSTGITKMQCTPSTNVKNLKYKRTLDSRFPVNIFLEVFQSDPPNVKKSLPSSTVLVQYDLSDCHNGTFTW